MPSTRQPASPGGFKKSSMQGGVDTLSDGAGGQLAIGIEAKRYHETTTLAVDDLKKKLFDAATRSGPPIELWIFAASKEVSADDVGALTKIGEELGLGSLSLTGVQAATSLRACRFS